MHQMRVLRRFLAGVLIGVLSFAPPAQGQDLQWGISAGGTSGTFRGDTATFAGTSLFGTELPARFAGRHTGLFVGGDVRFPISGWLGARAALRYVQQGGVVDRELLGPADGRVDETARFTFHDLTVPLLIQARLYSVPAAVRTSVFVGPSLDVNLASRVHRKGVNRSRDYEYDRTSGFDTRRSSVAVVVGTEVAYRFSTGQELALDVRYRRGLTNAAETGPHAVRTSTVAIGLRYIRSL